MADENEPQVEEAPVREIEAPELPAVSGPAKVETEQEPREPTAEVVKDQADALVVQPREADSDKVNVHEVHVVTDERVYDRAIVPPEGRGSLDLPIHGLGGERVEDVFAREASTPSE
jgi:hypothetical protein